MTVDDTRVICENYRSFRKVYPLLSFFGTQVTESSQNRQNLTTERFRLIKQKKHSRMQQMSQSSLFNTKMD